MSKMSAPSTSGLSVELLLRVIDVKYGYFTLLDSSRLRRCCFGTRPRPFAENDHFEAEIAPLPSIYYRVAKKRTR